MGDEESSPDYFASPAGCPACSPGRSVNGPLVHTPVHTFTQFMSTGLIEAIVYRGMDPGDDPRWAESGACDRAEYAYWSGRACGMACLQMILDHYGRAVPGLIELCRDACAAGCYVRRADGGVDGMFYRPFTEFLLKRFDLVASVEAGLSRDRLAEVLGRGALVLASVHREVRRPCVPSPGQGGHLVLITGYDTTAIHLRNPSGHTDAARNATLPWARFELFFAMRGVAVLPPAR